jgi:hypothetical protein
MRPRGAERRKVSLALPPTTQSSDDEGRSPGAQDATNDSRAVRPDGEYVPRRSTMCVELSQQKVNNASPEGPSSPQQIWPESPDSPSMSEARQDPGIHS